MKNARKDFFFLSGNENVGEGSTRFEFLSGGFLNVLRLNLLPDDQVKKGCQGMT